MSCTCRPGISISETFQKYPLSDLTFTKWLMALLHQLSYRFGSWITPYLQPFG